MAVVGSTPCWFTATVAVTVTVLFFLLGLHPGIYHAICLANINHKHGHLSVAGTFILI